MPDVETGIDTEVARSESVDQLAEALGAESQEATEAQPSETTDEQPSGASGADLSGLPESFKEAIRSVPPEAQAQLAQAFREADKPRLADYTRKTQKVAERERAMREAAALAEPTQKILTSRNPEAIRLYNEALMRAAGLGEETQDDDIDLDAITDPKQFRSTIQKMIDRGVERRLGERDAKTAEHYESIRAEAVETAESWSDVLSEEEMDAAWKSATATHPQESFKPGTGKVGSIYGKALREMYAKKIAATAAAPPKKAPATRAATVGGGAEFTSPRDLAPWEKAKRPPQGGEVVLDELRKIGLTEAGLRDLMRPGGARSGPPKV